MKDKIEIWDYVRNIFGDIYKKSADVMYKTDDLYNRIVKKSENIIDLVQAGDLVYYTIKGLEHWTYIDIVKEHTNVRTLEKTLRIRMYKLEQLNIKKILTKEQINGSFFEVVE